MAGKMSKRFISRNELLNQIDKAKNRVRVYGAVAFNIPFTRYREQWFEKINSGEFHVDIVCESESSLSYNSLISSDKSVSGQGRGYDIGTFLNIVNEPVKNLRNYLMKKGCAHLEPEDEKQCLSIRVCFLPMRIPVINIDDKYYVSLAMNAFCDLTKFELIDARSEWADDLFPHFEYCFDNPYGAKKYSTEISTADNLTEVILMYNDKRQVMGQLPRDSFLGSTRVKLVIWGMLFTRDGRLLIHQRGKNAKDNRAMWDKSIGGHVDINDIDTVKAAAREMLEELYKVEKEAQGDHSKKEAFEVNPDKPNFLGEWRPDMRYVLPFSEIANNEEEIYFFRMDYKLSKTPISSPRVLPDGTEQPVRCFVDLYVFVMPENFSEVDLKNSKYALLELHEIKEKYLDTTKGFEVTINDQQNEFQLTPDMKSIINSGDLWEEQLTSFVGYLKDNLNK